MEKKNQRGIQADQGKERNHQPDSVKNNAPGYGNKKLEGPNRPST